MKLHWTLTDKAVQSELLKGNEVRKYQTMEVSFAEISQADRELLLKHCFLVKEVNLVVTKNRANYNAYPFSLSDSLESVIHYQVPISAITYAEIVSELQRFDKENTEAIVNTKRDLEKKCEEVLSNKSMPESTFGEPKEKMIKQLTYYGVDSKIVEKIDKKYEEEERRKIEENLLCFIKNKRASMSWLRFNTLLEDEVYNEKLLSEILEEAKSSDELRQKIFAENKRRKEEQENKAIAKIEKEKTEKEGIIKLKEWGLSNGSELLKARIEENIHWISLAEKEYFKSIMPEKFEFLRDNVDKRKERTQATLKEIKILRIWRKKCEESNGLYKSPELTWNIVDSKTEETGNYIEGKQFATLDIDLVAPNGSIKTVSYRF